MKKILKTSLICSILLLIVSTLSAQDNNNGQFPWMNFENVVDSNSENPKKIMLFMEADWCTVCKQMKREVFPDQVVHTLVNDHFYPVRIDIESKEKIPFENQMITKMDLSKQLGVNATPTFIFLDHDYSVIGNKIGYSDTQEFAALLEFINNEEYKHTSFEEYLNNIQ